MYSLPTVSVDISVDEFVNVSVDELIDVSIDEFVDVSVDISVDEFVDVSVDVHSREESSFKDEGTTILPKTLFRVLAWCL